MLKQLYSKHLLFIVFAFSIFIKNVLFRMATAHLDTWSTLMEFPVNFFVFWLGKLMPAIVIASFVYIFRRQWWTIVVSILIDIWIISNLLYFKANGLYLTFETIMMAGNLHGYESSILSYFGWDVFAILFITVVYIICYNKLHLYRNSLVSGSCFVIWLAFSLSIDCIGNFSFNRNYYLVSAYGMRDITLKERFHSAWPFAMVYADAKESACVLGRDTYSQFSKDYMYFQSVVSYMPAVWLHHCWGPNGKKIKSLSQSEQSDIQVVFGNELPSPLMQPKRNLVFVLVESLESWALDDVGGWDYMPHLRSLKTQDHFFFANKIKNQISHGVSGDGQLICMTGLLPTQYGVACMHFGESTYPNFASSFASSAVVDNMPDVWNKWTAFRNYGFERLIYSELKNWGDGELIGKTIEYVDSVQTNPFCVATLTVTSHVPFKYGAEHPYHIDSSMPEAINDYLNCLVYADSCIAEIVHHVVEDSLLASNTTIVITGDHTAFRSVYARDIVTGYASHGSINYHDGDDYVPLIIYSPDIVGNEHYEGEAYQMDVFPTVCALIDSTAVVRTLGVNLRDSVAVANRTITEAEAYRLSDMIIRSDYFGQERKNSVVRQ